MSSYTKSRSRGRSRPPKSSNLPLIVFLIAIPVLGLAGFAAYRVASAPQKPAPLASAETKPKKATKKTAPAETQEVASAPKPDYPSPSRSSGSSSSSASSGFSSRGGRSSGPFAAGSLQQAKAQADYMTNESATDRVGWEIVDTLDTRPTLAIWLFDRSPSAAGQRAAVTGRLKEVLKGFDELKKQGHKGFANTSKGPPLLTAIAAYGKTCEILTPEPTDDTAELTAALERVTEDNDASENTFGAVKQVLDEFMKFHTEQKRYLVLTIVTDERGDDMAKVDELAPIVEKNLVLVYCIGVPAPFGRDGTLTMQPMMELGKIVQVGPESRESEMIDLDTRGLSLRNELLDSGFGPFALCRLCKASEDGAYLIVRGGGDGGGSRWGSGSAARHFESKIMARYAPDYVSQAEYDALLADNKCRMALHKAAMLPPIKIDAAMSLVTAFVREDESKLKRECDRAEQAVARVEPMLRPLYDALQPGESDRAKLTGARWQAAYDLSMGRVLAAKAKFEGYNSMVAQLKQGKRPGGPNDNVWTMVPAETFSTDSTLDKMVKKSRMYLERVVNDHKGTPWEMLAQRELGTLSGWEWMASK